MSDRTDPATCADETLSTLRRVHSSRNLGRGPIPDETLLRILEVGRWTGSSSNRQPWTFVVVRDPETLRAMAEASPNTSHVGRAELVIAIVMGGPDLPGGPQPTSNTFDEGRVAERILVAATALGLASAIGWILAGGRDAVRDLLGIPEDRLIRTVISLGHPGPATAPRSAPGTARKPLEEIVRYGRFA